MDRKTITISSAVNLNNYSKDILFTLKDKNKGLFVGKKEFYNNAGLYDNTTNTLKKITDNTKLYTLLYGTYSHIALAGFIYSGRYSLEDIKEFYSICKKLNIKYYDEVEEEKDNKIFYKLEEKHKKQMEVE